MEEYYWVGLVLMAAGLGWSMFRDWRDRRSCISVNCTVSDDPTLTGKKVMVDSWSSKMVVFAIENSGAIPVSVVGIEVSFKQTNSSKDKPITNLLPNPIFLRSGEIHRHESHSLPELWRISVATMPSCVKRVPVPNSNDCKEICDIKTIHVVDSLGKRCKVAPKEVEHINRELFEIAFVSS